MNNRKFDTAFDLVKQAAQSGVFPGAAAAAGYSGGIYGTGVTGCRCLEPEVLPVLPDTLFDLASLTKVVATTTLFMLFQEKGLLSSLDTVSRYVAGFSGGEKGSVTLRNLLTHTSGLSAHIRLDLICRDREDALRYLAEMQLETAPSERVIYSCLGFILLGRILETVGGDSLDNLCRKLIFEPLGMEHTGFKPISTNIAATEYEEGSGRMLIGQCHDENARFLGSVSGNAGLFSDISDMCTFATMLLNRGMHAGRQFLSKASVDIMTRNYTAHMNEDRGLGWSLKGHRLHGIDVKAASAGDLFSPEAYGHTGYTGTSLWIDPVRDVYAILLSNRVHPVRGNDSIHRFRALFNNAVVAECCI